MPGEWVRQPGHGGLRVLFLVALLSAQALVPTASAQVPAPTYTFPITLDRDPAVYDEGDAVQIVISFATAQSQTAKRTRVFCVSGCPTGENAVYEAPISSYHLFPSNDFCQLVNGVRDCSRPTAGQRYEPRWNGSWAVSINDAAGLELYRAPFEVAMTNAWKYEYRMEPTLTIKAKAGGFVPGTEVTVSFGRLNAAGQDVLFRNVTARASTSGTVSAEWRIPKEQGLAVQCEVGHCRKYFVEARAAPGVGTKASERVWYQLHPARIHPAIILGPDPLGMGVDFERTETVRFLFQTWYPALIWTEKEDFAKIGEDLRVEVRRIDPGTGLPSVVVKAAPRYITAGIWEYNWTIPRELPLKTPQGRAYEFQIVVPEGKDRYGNRVDTNSSSVFSVNPAALAGDFAERPEVIERQAPGRWVLAPRYHDGRPFDDTVNETWLSGHFVRITNQGDVPVPESTVRAKYAPNGTWIFEYKFARGYAYPGRHAFVFDGGPVGANDTWNNYVRSNRTEFDLVHALPKIVLTEKAGNAILNATTGWKRGTTVDLVARIAYGDGSAYNSSRHHERGWLNATLEKRRGQTEVIETVLLPFRIRDEFLGTWTASIPLTLTDRETPAGNWTLRFNLQDTESPPNGGERVFRREVRPTVIRVDPKPLDRTNYLLGSTVTWQFGLAYPDGRVATEQDLPSLAVDVYRWSGERVLGLETSNLAAEYRSDRQWQVAWTPPNGVRLGEFVLVPRGADKFGNPVDARRSDAFRVFVPTIEREVITQPPPSIARNETAYVVFDGLPGDVGEDESGCPRIAVQRWAGNRWVIEVEDVYARTSGGCATGGDHFGAWQTTDASTLGTYRFAFFGRNAQRAYVNATSGSFQLLPLSATRPIVAEPPESILKGERARVEVARLPTDQFSSAWVVSNGERLVRATLSSPSLTRWAVSWTPDYRIASGSFHFELEGRDRHGNELRVTSRPFDVQNVPLRTEVLEDLPPTTRRGETVTMTFRAYLPDDNLVGAVHGAPVVKVVGPGGVATELKPSPAPPNWKVEYRVPHDLPFGSYRLVISGADSAGNPFEETSSENLTILPGFIDRTFETPPRTSSRLTRITAAAHVNRTDDKQIVCFGSYIGGGGNPQEVSNAVALSTLDITYAPNPAKGVVDMSWTPPRDAALGWYRFDCDGKDAHGNVLRYRSSAFQVGGAGISPTSVPGGKPLPPEFVGGQSLAWRVKIAYPDKTILTPEYVTATSPEFVWTLDGVRVEQKPEVTFDAAKGEWVATWTVPEVLPSGKFALIVQGLDVFGNRILALRVAEYDVEPTVGERLFGIPGIERAVPGPGALLSILAALGVALVVVARRR